MAKHFDVKAAPELGEKYLGRSLPDAKIMGLIEFGDQTIGALVRLKNKKLAMVDKEGKFSTLPVEVAAILGIVQPRKKEIYIQVENLWFLEVFEVLAQEKKTSVNNLMNEALLEYASPHRERILGKI